MENMLNNNDAKVCPDSSHLPPASFSQVFDLENKLKFIESIKEARIPFFESEVEFKEAAVLVPFCYYEGEPSILFTLRSQNLKRHKGEVSFPGGQVDKCDNNYIETALRETEEEVGISRSLVDVWTTSTPLMSRFHRVTPVFGFVGEVKIEDLHINPAEVDLVFIRSLKSLCDSANWIEVTSSLGFVMPGFLGGEHKIWGLTGIILDLALSNLCPKIYTRDFTIKIPSKI